MSTLCAIPARGGSKGIPRKNLLPVAGKPLIAWTIEQALAARDPHGEPLRVVVSTEDAEIAQVARAHGAEVVVRPDELAQDTTPTEPVVLHVIDEMAAAGDEPEIVMLLQATSPIRLPSTLPRALAEFAAGEVDSMVGVVPHAPFFWWMGDPPRADYPYEARPRRQDLTPEMYRYRETGSLYVTRTRVYREQNNRLGGRIALFVMDEVEGVDIDTDIDLRLTEQALLATQQTQAPTRAEPVTKEPEPTVSQERERG